MGEVGPYEWFDSTTLHMMKIGSLCTGYGGFDLAVSTLVDVEMTWASDIDKNASKIVAHHWPSVPNLGDLKVIDWSTLEPVDFLTAGYPCQPFSAAGNRKGVEDERHLWPYIAEGIGVLRPRFVLLENVRGHLSLGGGQVARELADLGYVVRWSLVRASDIGAPHQRARLFIVAANAEHLRQSGRSVPGGMGSDQGSGSWLGMLEPERGASPPCVAPDPESERLDRRGETRNGWPGFADSRYEPAIRRWESILGRPAPSPLEPGTKKNVRLSATFVEWMMGLPEGHVTQVPDLSRSAQIKALGNGVVPQQAAYALAKLLG